MMRGDQTRSQCAHTIIYTNHIDSLHSAFEATWIAVEELAAGVTVAHNAPSALTGSRFPLPPPPAPSTSTPHTAPSPHASLRHHAIQHAHPQRTPQRQRTVPCTHRVGPCIDREKRRHQRTCPTSRHARREQTESFVEQTDFLKTTPATTHRSYGAETVYYS